jgi:pimeloyl-ACP methyl ester carboxylesterase
MAGCGGTPRHLGIDRTHVMDIRWARISAFLALREPERVATVVFGLGLAVEASASGTIAAAFLAGAAEITDPRGKAFRAFFDQTKSDRRALARASQRRAGVDRRRRRPHHATVLVAVGTKDDIAGDPDELAALMPNAQSFWIEHRDHMQAVGDKTFKHKVLEFLAESALQAVERCLDRHAVRIRHHPQQSALCLMGDLAVVLPARG